MPNANLPTMLNVTQHAWLLGHALSGIGGENLTCWDCHDYLSLAAGIRNINYDIIRFRDDVGYCETADAHHVDENELRRELVHRIAIFQFAWAAFEAYQHLFPRSIPPKVPRRRCREIDSICFHLSKNHAGPLPLGLEGLVELFKRGSHLGGIGRAKSATHIPNWLTQSAEGIYRVYELRNSFAHGDFHVPFPAGDPTKHPDVLTVTLAARIVLLTIQVMTLVKYPENEFVDLSEVSSGEEDEQCPKVKDVFLNLHIDGYIEQIKDRINSPVA